MLNPREERVYILSSTDCSVVSQLFNEARHAGRFKLGSKPAKFYARHGISHCFTHCKIFTQTFTGTLSLESKGKQVSSGLQDSTEYSSLSWWFNGLIVFILPLNSSSSIFFCPNPLWFVPSRSTIFGITIVFMFQNFSPALWQGISVFLSFSLTFIFMPKEKKSTRQLFSSFWVKLGLTCYPEYYYYYYYYYYYLLL